MRQPIFAMMFGAMLAMVPLSPVLAVSPSDLPLPACEEVNGQESGACPLTNEHVYGDGGTQTLVAGGSITIKTDSVHPVCDHHIGYPPYPWSPGPCYSAVYAPRVVGCGYIDLQDENVFKETSCSQALYDGGVAADFTVGDEEGSGCGGSGDYYTYVYGGPANVAGARWVERGPALRFCNITLNSARPNSLRGPTWVKVRVSLDKAENGDERRGNGESAELFVPVDGDLAIEGVDVAVRAEATISEPNWDEGQLIATYTARVTNIGDEDAENVTLIASFPGDLTVVQSVSDTGNCLLPGISDPDFTPAYNARLKVGGQVNCKWSTLASGDFHRVELRVRIINATDLDALQSGVTLKKFDQSTGNVAQGVAVRVSADDDVDSSNNEELVKVDIPFRTGSYEGTEMAMLALASYFDYYVDDLFEQCNVYMNDIFSRLEATRLSVPEVFNELSYGNITSGQYAIGGTFGQLESSGHVGVVVYPKGTNYRETGIIIHGTPTQSPLNFNSKLGPDNESDASFISSSTSLGGFYYRTRAEDFPGFPQYESNKGFEGEYSNNAAEFTVGGSTPDPIAPDPNPSQCALPPEAVTVVTASPVDLVITNSSGAVVETSGDEIVQQSLGMGIHSMAFEHDDGSYGWVIVLPKDDYTVTLTGYATGPYTLTMTTYNDQGEPQETVIEGYTEAGQVETFELTDALPEPEPEPEPEQIPSSSGSGGSGGGGSFGAPTLLALLMLSLWVRRRSVSQSLRRVLRTP